MQIERCSGCGAQLTPGPDGRLGGCSYCGVAQHSAIDASALASTLGREMADVHKFVEHLASTLESAFPAHVRVERSGIFSKHVSKLEIETGHMVYRLEIEHSHAVAHRSRAVRGVALKTEKIPVAEWIQELSAALSAMASESQAAHAALARALR